MQIKENILVRNKIYLKQYKVIEIIYLTANVNGSGSEMTGTVRFKSTTCGIQILLPINELVT